MHRSGWVWPLVLAGAVAAESPAIDVGRLLELNRDSDQQLRQIQRDDRATNGINQPDRGRDAMQRDAQRLLQDRQHRELLRDHHRASTGGSNANVPEHPAARQQRYRSEQQHQLQRFRLQQGLR